MVITQLRCRIKCYFQHRANEKISHSILQAEAVGVSIPGAYASVAGDNPLQRRCCNSRVGKGISAQAAPRTVRESLPSYGSYYPIMLLFQSSNDKTTMGFLLVSIDTFCTTCSCPVSYMCSSSTYGLVHSNNKIRHVFHLC